MTTQILDLKTKTTTKDGKDWWNNNQGTVFVNTDDAGNITSVSVKLNLLQTNELVAFPKRAKQDSGDNNVTE